MEETKTTKMNEISDLEAYKICIDINSQLIALAASNSKVLDRYQQYEIIKEELKVLSENYKGQALNGLFEKILQNFSKLEQEVTKNLNSYKSNYGDPNKVGDGYC